MPMIYILIDCSLSRMFKWRNKEGYITVQQFRIKFFFYGKNNTWRNPRDFPVKQVSVLSIFIATAYDILRFSTISEIIK